MAKSKTYLVQTWNAEGGQNNHYEVVIEHPAELKELRQFLEAKNGHVLLTQQPDRLQKAARVPR